MPERRGPALYTIPAHRAFADALAAGLIRRFGRDPLELARGIVLLPSNRARRTVQDAFVRASGGGLLLPRLVAIGNPELDEATGVALDPADDHKPVPPAIAPLERRMILARLIEESDAGADAAEAFRLAGDLARTLDALLIEEIPPRRLRDLDLGELSAHWARSLAMFELVLDRWPAELARRGRIDLADRRSRLLRRLCTHWREAPPNAFVCAAGVTGSAPAIAGLLRCVSELPRGMVVLPDLDMSMAADAWDALGPHVPDPATGLAVRSIETHPQFHLKLLLARMGVHRDEFDIWRDRSEHDSDAARGRAIANALAPAAFTGSWSEIAPEDRRLSGVGFAEFATPAEEAQAIALKLREALETPGKTAALVTPDRALARRVAAHCARWGIDVDDSAGQPLSILPSGTLLLALAEALAADFAPLPLLTLLKHPLVRAGDGRAAWLEGARRLDLALRGPRPAPGLDGIDAHLAGGLPRERGVRRTAAAWWKEARAALAPLADAPTDPTALLDRIREVAGVLCGDVLWAGAAGRAAAELFAAVEEAAPHGPTSIDPATLPALLKTLLSEVAVRPPQGGHPRLAILGLVEAQLQTADLMILGGLNEGIWPALAAPDPWLAPRIRRELGLPALERRIGLAAHDFAGAMGAREVLVTRARRDSSAPTLASRFWLRLEALAGERFERDAALEHWARALDEPGEHQPERRPEPVPPRELRPTLINVTEVDRLKADPYAFYAQKVLKLGTLDAVDADPSAAWRGTVVHAILEAWAREDDCAPDKLAARAEALLRDDHTHPLLRALWEPRLAEAIGWIAAHVTEDRAADRTVLGVEKRGEIDLGGVRLAGRLDRIDRLSDGTLAVVDYKTGKPPSIAAVREGYSLQLGLLGLIAERGGLEGISGAVRGFEYWSLGRNRDGGFGYVESPADPKRRDPIDAESFTAMALDNLMEAAGKWLTGDEPFTAKLHSEFAPYADYDQLMRRDEWYGRE